MVLHPYTPKLIFKTSLNLETGASHFFVCHCERNEVERGNPINWFLVRDCAMTDYCFATE
ncbi:MAG: hypothetical protein ACR9NN_04430 [Nostochopsis sp.]